MACAARHGTYGAGVCQGEREDYIECLHHNKLVQMLSCTCSPYCFRGKTLTFGNGDKTESYTDFMN